MERLCLDLSFRAHVSFEKLFPMKTVVSMFASKTRRILIGTINKMTITIIKYGEQQLVHGSKSWILDLINPKIMPAKFQMHFSVRGIGNCAALVFFHYRYVFILKNCNEKFFYPEQLSGALRRLAKIFLRNTMFNLKIDFRRKYPAISCAIKSSKLLVVYNYLPGILRSKV